MIESNVEALLSRHPCELGRPPSVTRGNLKNIPETTKISDPDIDKIL